MHEFQPAPGASEAEVFARGMEVVDAAETLGLDVMWLADLHFAPRLSVLSSPMVVAGAIAARTRRIKIGAAVLVLPLGDPLRLAEEVATVDHLSGGRFICGVGRSNFANAYRIFGIPYAQSRDRMFEVLEVMKRAWTSASFSYEGAYHRYENVTVVPKPLQQPHPPVRIAVETADSAEAAARLGHPILVSVRIGAFDELGPLVRAYRGARRAAGHAGEGEVYLRAPIYIGETDRQARSEAEASMTAFHRHVADLLEGSAKGPDGRIDARRIELAAKHRAKDWDRLLSEHLIVGDASAVVERLSALEEDVGLSGVLAEINCGGLVPHERVIGALRRLCTRVMPAL
jgi:alkanesulfonate monooxygenase SsuD/methylene tetrahydromethanopterin reductase-like flavin-dependent oxidoreductase (luciferase family)